MSRGKSSIKNTIIALISEIVVTGIGFLFPRAIILNYGSEANGLITSLQQFIQYFMLLDSGLSGAAVFALYKPLAENDYTTIARILYSTKRMYTKIGSGFIGCIIVGACFYPFFIAETGYSKLTVAALFCLTGFNGATQLLFIGKFKVLLNASQNNRYISIINSMSTCLYSILIIIASYCKLPLLVAVGLGTVGYFVRAISFLVVTHKLFPEYNYKYCENTYVFENQKEVFVQQILSLLILNSSMVILSFTKTNMAEISVFTVYNMVLTAIFMVTNAVNTGISASFGDLIARKDLERLKKVYMEYEVLFQIFWTVIFSCVVVLYQPFIRLYTSDFTDAQYVRPSLCVLFSVLGAIWVIRNQQSVLIVAAGKFKEIQKGSIFEAVLTIVLSLVGLYLLGIQGLLLGRILSALFRAVDFIRYGNKEVIKIAPRFTGGQIILSICVILAVYGCSKILCCVYSIDSYLDWILFACFISIIAVLISIISNWVFNKDQIKNLFLRFWKIKI